MSKWGVFTDDDGLRHSAPCDDEGYVLPPHVLYWNCDCAPFLLDGIWVHVDPERGGGRTSEDVQ